MSQGDCPQCGGDSKVVDSRRNRTGIRRRRECLKCAHRWRTLEIDINIYGIYRMTPTQHLPELAKNLVRQHLLMEHTFASIVTDAVFCDLPADLRADYHQAEAVFLAAAAKTGQRNFQLDYDGEPFTLQCDSDYEEVAIDLVIKLGVA